MSSSSASSEGSYVDDGNYAPYDIVNSFQGAFGMPTLGHVQSMLFSALATAEKYSGKNILMLFMPTAAGSEKPHLVITQAERIQALSMACDYLTSVIASDPTITIPAGTTITFKVSPLEYNIYDYAEPETTPEESRTLLFGKGARDTATIWTILKLRELGAKGIVLTMGKDNLFDLPFWKRVQDYPSLLTDSTIFVVDRSLTDADMSKTNAITFGDKSLRFSKSVKWIKNTNGNPLPVARQLDKVVSSISLPGKPSETKSLGDFISSINVVDLPKPSGTSSSLLRCALYGYYKRKMDLPYEEHLDALLGAFAPLLPKPTDSEEVKNKNPWYRSFIITEAIVAPKCLLYADDYAVFAASEAAKSEVNSEMAGGRRRRHKSHKKHKRSVKKSKKSRRKQKN
jgi:nicotinic acid mononucleotide adenylyltransferase